MNVHVSVLQEEEIKIGLESEIIKVETPGDYIPVPSIAEVGQTIVVKAVDDKGKPTEWKAVDMPSGGGASVELDTTLTQIGKAADAKAVGDALADKQPKGDYLTQNELPDMTAYRTAEAQNVIDAGKQDTLIQSGATIGQIAKIKAVDDMGKPTAWEATDISAAQTYEVLFEVEEAVESVEWDFVDNEGNPVLLQEVEVVQHFISTNQSGADLNAKILMSNGNTKYVIIANNYANTAGNWVAAVSVAKIYGETLYALSNKTVSSSPPLNYSGAFTKQGVLYPIGWGDRWNEFNGVKIRGIIGLKVPGAVGAKGQFYVCGVKAK